MSDRQIMKFKRRLENRIAEIENEIYSLNMKEYWDEIDVFNHVSLYNEMKDLRKALSAL